MINWIRTKDQLPAQKAIVLFNVLYEDEDCTIEIVQLGFFLDNKFIFCVNGESQIKFNISQVKYWVEVDNPGELDD